MLKDIIESHAGEILLEPSATFSSLNEASKTDLAIGFQSDFNGWLDHHRPRYGKEGCFEADPNGDYEAIELEGMPHPGLLESHWTLLEKEGVDLSPVHRASEKFLQMWESVRARKK